MYPTDTDEAGSGRRLAWRWPVEVSPPRPRVSQVALSDVDEAAIDLADHDLWRWPAD